MASNPSYTDLACIGELVLLPGNSPANNGPFAGPSGLDVQPLVPCDGRLLQVAAYNLLFSVLGPSYGGNGSTTFAVPNLPPPSPELRWFICANGYWLNPT